MIGYLSGKIKWILEDRCILEVNHIGYEVIVPTRLLTGVGMALELYTSMQLRQDDISLFGFATMAELSLFKKLIQVNGVGPKAAMNILSTLSLEQVQGAILSKDSKLLSVAPGIGKKTAERIILELQDKIHLEDLLPQTQTLSQSASISPQKLEALEALEALGFGRSQVYSILESLTILEDANTSEIIKLCLNELNA